MTEQADEAMARAREELEVLRKVLEALEPIETMEARSRVIAAVAARFGHYDIARDALRNAADWRKEEDETPP